MLCKLFSPQRTLFTVDAQLISFGEACFRRSSLTRLQPPQTVTRIGVTCFAQSHLFAEITFPPDSCFTEIGEFAFGSTSVRKLCIPGSTEIHSLFIFAGAVFEFINFAPNSKLRSIVSDAF
jgi:hypothetical protein